MGKYQARWRPTGSSARTWALVGRGPLAPRDLHRPPGRRGRPDARRGAGGRLARAPRRRRDGRQRRRLLRRQGAHPVRRGSSSTRTARSSSERRSPAPRSRRRSTRRRSPWSARSRSTTSGTRCRRSRPARSSGSACSRRTGCRTVWRDLRRTGRQLGDARTQGAPICDILARSPEAACTARGSPTGWLVLSAERAESRASASLRPVALRKHRSPRADVQQRVQTEVGRASFVCASVPRLYLRPLPLPAQLAHHGDLSGQGAWAWSGDRLHDHGSRSGTSCRRAACSRRRS